jgi:magnesium-transporting ATPase (P-type)
LFCLIYIGALKAAHAGISLSNSEASIASPFTSKNQNIECVPTLIREGRAALVTSSGIVKFICMYSLTQFVTVLILYTIGHRMSNGQFLYIDIFLITLISIFFSLSGTCDTLDERAPKNKLVAWRPICSILAQVVINSFFQLLVFYLVRMQPWYEVFIEDNEEENGVSMGPYENSAVFFVSVYQYIFEAIIYSKGMPYRKSIFRNFLLMIMLIGASGINLFMALTTIREFGLLFIVRSFPSLGFRFIILGIVAINFFVSFIFESFIFDDDFFRITFQNKMKNQ